MQIFFRFSLENHRRPAPPPSYSPASLPRVPSFLSASNFLSSFSLQPWTLFHSLCSPPRRHTLRHLDDAERTSLWCVLPSLHLAVTQHASHGVFPPPHPRSAATIRQCSWSPGAGLAREGRLCPFAQRAASLCCILLGLALHARDGRNVLLLDTHNIAFADHLRVPQSDRFIPTRSAMDLDVARFALNNKEAVKVENALKAEIVSPAKACAESTRVHHLTFPSRRRTRSGWLRTCCRARPSRGHACSLSRSRYIITFLL